MSENLDKYKISTKRINQTSKELGDPQEKNGFTNIHLAELHKKTPDDARAVIAMRLADIPKKRIAKILGVSMKILEKHYAVELDLAHEQMDKLVMSKFIEGVKEGDSKLIQFYLRNKKGWTEKQEHLIEHKVSRSREEIEQELRELGVPEEKLRDI